MDIPKLSLLLISLLVSLLSSITSFFMRKSTMDARMSELASRFEFENGTAFAIDLFLYPIYLFVIHAIIHTIIIFMTIVPKRYPDRVDVRSIFKISECFKVNLIMVIAGVVAIYYVSSIFMNIHYPLWTKFVVLLSVLLYYTWILLITKERSQLIRNE